MGIATCTNKECRSNFYYPYVKCLQCGSLTDHGANGRVSGHWWYGMKKTIYKWILLKEDDVIDTGVCESSIEVNVDRVFPETCSLADRDLVICKNMLILI